ncbi:TraR/DksA family transcriptional regulator [Cronobacter dublinensis]|nr:TraR/DksA family transcriptional regulator [Cronobacter dublinensis]EKF2291190.1 TraR/DksA family transcriptional regulator [Cronobacter dublinensis]EKF2295206.1 TraR/DksA family transcriptional regulator [Cronobacter dublinensis]EKK5270377.1 TraR/DksA family transcriptional regulator [Cronobacter dublinensis]EKM0136022.1 TraR/DksA family transcriptional regulator [Cronobacter dublinensis]
MIDDIDRDQTFNEQYLQTLIAQYRPEPSCSPSRDFCLDCGDPIPEKRRQLIPGVRLCVHCQVAREQCP